MRLICDQSLKGGMSEKGHSKSQFKITQIYKIPTRQQITHKQPKSKSERAKKQRKCAIYRLCVTIMTEPKRAHVGKYRSSGGPIGDW